MRSKVGRKTRDRARERRSRGRGRQARRAGTAPETRVGAAAAGVCAQTTRPRQHRVGKASLLATAKPNAAGNEKHLRATPGNRRGVGPAPGAASTGAWRRKHDSLRRAAAAGEICPDGRRRKTPGAVWMRSGYHYPGPTARRWTICSFLLSGGDLAIAASADDRSSRTLCRDRHAVVGPPGNADAGNDRPRTARYAPAFTSPRARFDGAILNFRAMEYYECTTGGTSTPGGAHRPYRQVWTLRERTATVAARAVKLPSFA